MATLLLRQACPATATLLSCVLALYFESPLDLATPLVLFRKHGTFILTLTATASSQLIHGHFTPANLDVQE